MMVWMIGLMVQIEDLETFVSVLDIQTLAGVTKYMVERQ